MNLQYRKIILFYVSKSKWFCSELPSRLLAGNPILTVVSRCPVRAAGFGASHCPLPRPSLPELIRPHKHLTHKVELSRQNCETCGWAVQSGLVPDVMR